MQVRARLPISFEAANAKEVHAPLIVGTFARAGVAGVPGVEARLVLDTGSDTNLLTDALAVTLNLARQPGEEGVDHSGATMPSWTVGDVAMLTGGLAVDLRDVVVIPAPGAFDELGIGGILSPQQLHPPRGRSSTCSAMSCF